MSEACAECDETELTCNAHRTLRRHTVAYARMPPRLRCSCPECAMHAGPDIIGMSGRGWVVDLPIVQIRGDRTIVLVYPCGTETVEPDTSEKWGDCMNALSKPDWVCPPPERKEDE